MAKAPGTRHAEEPKALLSNAKDESRRAEQGEETRGRNPGSRRGSHFSCQDSADGQAAGNRGGGARARQPRSTRRRGFGARRNPRLESSLGPGARNSARSESQRSDLKYPGDWIPLARTDRVSRSGARRRLRRRPGALGFHARPAATAQAVRRRVGEPSGLPLGKAEPKPYRRAIIPLAVPELRVPGQAARARTP